MKHIRRIFLILFSAMLLSSVVWAAAKLPALSTSKYIQTYTLNTSGKVYAYTDSTLKKQKSNCWISCANDECYIVKISGNAISVSYPLDKGGRSTQWFKRSDFTTANLAGSLKYETFYKQVTTYRHFNGKVNYGYVGKNDKVYILGTNGAYTQVIYPLTNGKWKMAWAKTSEVNAALKVPATPTPTHTPTPTPIPAPKDVTVSNGKYHIATALDRNLVLDVNNNSSANGTNIQIYSSNNSAAQDFTVTKLSSGWYTIKHTESGKCVDVSGGTKASGVNVQLYQSNGTDAQLWKFQSATSGGYYIKNKLGYYLDVSGGNAKSGNNVWVYSLNRSNAQIWYLSEIQPPVSFVTMYVKTSGSNLNVREKPSTSAKALGQLKNGAEVSVYSNYTNNDGWAKIKYNNGIAYVSAQYLSTNPPSVFSPVWPCASSSAYQITCLYYYKDGSKHSTRYGYTYGMDITGGGKIRAVEQGTVETATDLGSTSFGRYIVILHPNGTRSLYAHLSSFASGIKKGAKVTRGQVIGVMGTTGNSSGVHLHFELSNADPWKTYFKDLTNITFASNVRSNNNAKKSVDSNSKYIVNWIDKYYVYSGGVYRRK